MEKNDLFAKRAEIEKQIKVFTDKPQLTPDEQKQLDVLKKSLAAVGTEPGNQP